MPIAYDAQSIAGAAWGWSRTLAHVVGAGANYLKVFVAEWNNDGTGPACTGVTYNGVAMTQLKAKACTAWTTGYYYYLVNPAVGNHNIVVSWPPAANINSALGGVSYSGVGSPPHGTEVDGAWPNTNAAQSVNVPSAVNELVADGYAVWSKGAGSVIVIGAGQTSRGIVDAPGPGGNPGLGQSEEPGAALVNMGWTPGQICDQVIIAVGLRPIMGRRAQILDHARFPFQFRIPDLPWRRRPGGLPVPDLGLLVAAGGWRKAG